MRLKNFKLLFYLISGSILCDLGKNFGFDARRASLEALEGEEFVLSGTKLETSFGRRELFFPFNVFSDA